eukprot:scaffold34652_cov211-Amphora_coffeaeformis.AAC.12
MTRWLLLLAFPCLAAAFSVENHRVFVSTPVSKWPKRFVGDCVDNASVYFTRPDANGVLA